MAALCRPTDPEPMNQTINPDQHILSRTPASMPEVPQPCYPPGLGPISNHPGDMNNPSQINPLACAGAGGAAGHDAAACVSARSECAGACVYDARDASGSSSTTLPVRQVVAPHWCSNTPYPSLPVVLV